jgi:putative FmdB family regulatory protein
MPLYGFVCEECEEEFEELVMSASQTEEVSCPACESRKVHRQLSLVAAMKRTGSSTSSISSAGCAPGG